MTSTPEELEIDSFLNAIPQTQTYEQLQAEVKAEQSGKTREQIAADMARRSEAVFDPETAHQDHNWIDRGEVMSCEGAGHANHRHFKFKRR